MFPYVAVSDVQVHPRRLDTVLCASTDGTVRSFDSVQASSSALAVYGAAADAADDVYRVICSEPGAIASMDCDNSSDTCVLLAVSATGSAVRVAI